MRDQLEPIPYTDKTAKEFVERFCDHVHWLVRVRYIYTVLFEEEQPSNLLLMQKTASSFFADLNRILLEYLLLECAKITDPAETRGDENFTVDFLVNNIQWPTDVVILNGLVSLPTKDKDILKELKSLQTITENFRKYIKPARNKLIAHLDMKTVLSGAALGGFPVGEDQKFLDALQKICNITHEACFGTIYGDMIPISSGDVICLTKTLRYAVAFDEALSESSGQNETWLYSCLHKAGQKDV
jgi:hypothetical protein